MYELMARVEAQADEVSEEADVDDDDDEDVDDDDDEDVDDNVRRPGRPSSSCWDFFNDD